MHAAVFGRAFRTPDLRTKMLFALAMIALYRIGSYVPTPGVDYPAVQTCLDAVKGDSLYALINLFSGGALLQLSIFALGIMPYITASIILQLLTVVIPRLETLKKEGQAGQAKITQYTRYLTIGLAILQSTGIIALARSGQLSAGLPGADHARRLAAHHDHHDRGHDRRHRRDHVARRADHRPWHRQRYVAADLHLDHCRLPRPAECRSTQAQGAWTFVVVLGVGLAVVAFVVLMEQGQRRIPVQYAKRMVGRRQYGGIVHLHPDQGQPGRRHPGHLRLVDALSAGAVRDDQQQPGCVQHVGRRPTSCNGSGAWYAVHLLRA